MPELSFKVEGAEPVSFAVSPTLAFRLRVSNQDTAEVIHTVTLRCQIMIDPVRRRYTVDEQKRLLDLFGEPERWGHTLRSMLWTHSSVIVPSFTGESQVQLSVPCTFDFNIAATKYFAGLDDGEIPLTLLFSGSVFYEGETGELQVIQIPWDREVQYRLPVGIWSDMMGIYYPNTAWLCLRRDVFDRLCRYKMKQGLATWEQAIESVLPPDHLDKSNGNRRQ